MLNAMQPEAAILSVEWLIKSMQLGVQQAEETYNLLPSVGQLVAPDNPLPNFRPVKTEKQVNRGFTHFCTCEFISYILPVT